MIRRFSALAPLVLLAWLYAGQARAQEDAEFLLLWVLGNQEYVDSGMRFADAGECFAVAQNIGSSMQYVGLAPPRFFCIPLKPGYDFNLIKNKTGSRRLLF